MCGGLPGRDSRLRARAERVSETFCENASMSGGCPRIECKMSLLIDFRAALSRVRSVLSTYLWRDGFHWACSSHGAADRDILYHEPRAFRNQIKTFVMVETISINPCRSRFCFSTF